MPSQLVNNRQYFSTYYRKDNGYFAAYPDNIGIETFRRSRVWANSSNFKKVTRAQLLTQSYTDDTTVYNVSGSNIRFPGLNQGCEVGNVITRINQAIPALTDSDVVDCLDKAITNAASKVGDHTVDLGVTAAEFNKTHKMFNKAVTDLANAAVMVKRGQFSKAAQLLGIRKPQYVSLRGRSFSNNWLEYRYGWRTLMMDVDGAVRHLAQLCVSPPDIFVAKSAIDTSTSFTNEVGWQLVNKQVVGGEESFNSVFYQYDAGASITYRYKITNSNASQLAQLGMTNPLSLAWELIPYSFVVDWFINVGDVLQNLNSFNGKTLLDGTQTRYKQVTVITQPSSLRAKVSNYPLVYTPGIGSLRTVSYSRRLFDRSKINFLSVVPTVRVSLNTSRLIDAAGLLRQRFSK